MSGSDVQRAPIVYPPGLLIAVLPEDVDSRNCDHDNGVCACVHDWRINWGNVSRDPKPKATYLS